MKVKQRRLSTCGRKASCCALVEAVHLVDEHDGRAAPAQRATCGALHRLADVLHAAQHGRRSAMNCASNASAISRASVVLPVPGGPRGSAVRLARLKRHAQRHALAQQVLLADDLAQGLGPQAFG
jgi:hypothetical protein